MIIKKPYIIDSYTLNKEVLFKNRIVLLMSSEYSRFLIHYPGLTFQTAIEIPNEGETVPVHSFYSFSTLLELMMDEDWLEHLRYEELLSFHKVLPLCPSLDHN